MTQHLAVWFQSLAARRARAACEAILRRASGSRPLWDDPCGHLRRRQLADPTWPLRAAKEMGAKLDLVSQYRRAML
jgi:hypothetical protein